MPLMSEKQQEKPQTPKNFAVEEIYQKIEASNNEWKNVYTAITHIASRIKHDLDTLYNALSHETQTEPEIYKSYESVWEMLNREIDTITWSIESINTIETNQDSLQITAEAIDKAENRALRILWFMQKEQEILGLHTKETQAIDAIQKKHKKNYFTKGVSWALTCTQEANKPKIWTILWEVMNYDHKWEIDYSTCTNSAIKDQMVRLLWGTHWFIMKKRDGAWNDSYILINKAWNEIQQRPLIWEWVTFTSAASLLYNKLQEEQKKLYPGTKPHSLWGSKSKTNPVPSTHLLMAQNILEKKHTWLIEHLQSMPEHLQQWFIPLVERYLENHIIYAKAHWWKLTASECIKSSSNLNHLMKVTMSTPNGLQSRPFIDRTNETIDDRLFKLLQQNHTEFGKYLTERIYEKRNNYPDVPLRNDLLVEKKQNATQEAWNDPTIKEKKNWLITWIEFMQGVITHAQRKNEDNGRQKSKKRESIKSNLDDILYTLHIHESPSREDLQYLQNILYTALIDLYQWNQEEKSAHALTIDHLVKELIETPTQIRQHTTQQKLDTMKRIITHVNKYSNREDHLIPLTQNDRNNLITTNDLHKFSAHQSQEFNTNKNQT